MNKLQQLIDGCKCGVTVWVNQHRDYYETAEEHLRKLQESEPIAEPWIIAEMIALDTIINIHFYPRTPIGFYSIYDYDLERALARALACLEDE